MAHTEDRTQDVRAFVETLERTILRSAAVDEVSRRSIYDRSLSVVQRSAGSMAPERAEDLRLAMAEAVDIVEARYQPAPAVIVVETQALPALASTAAAGYEHPKVEEIDEPDLVSSFLYDDVEEARAEPDLGMARIDDGKVEDPFLPGRSSFTPHSSDFEIIGGRPADELRREIAAIYMDAPSARVSTPSPVAGRTTSVMDRLRSLRWREPSLWMPVGLAGLCVVFGLLFLAGNQLGAEEAVGPSSGFVSASER
jgi:hypothetical protein